MAPVHLCVLLVATSCVSQTFSKPLSGGSGRLERSDDPQPLAAVVDNLSSRLASLEASNTALKNQVTALENQLRAKRCESGTVQLYPHAQPPQQVSGSELHERSDDPQPLGAVVDNLASRLARVEASSTEMQNELGVLRAKRCESGVVGFAPHAQANVIAPDGNQSRTHTIHINFARPFATTPWVSIGMSEIDGMQFIWRYIVRLFRFVTRGAWGQLELQLPQRAPRAPIPQPEMVPKTQMVPKTALNNETKGLVPVDWSINIKDF
ncbi:hypothetical protein C0Q70_10578 [Pomacea canaliculata]|uniref:Uncharacterized protein n=1 Tax=Pomacea canaliculata TaxID=400727 RepID=A0A2T7P3L5_POMCA|nr:hypothetical protein C0Q70_10578 [Pomacea canaliculata]